MEDTTLRRFKGCLERLQFLWIHWLEETKREMRRKPIEQYGVSARVSIEPFDEEESNDVYAPAFSVVRIQGDGYNITVENTSAYDKSAYVNIRHRAEQDVWRLPPPLYDEGDTDA